jgi:spore cortex biosynthesis protein YabQ
LELGIYLAEQTLHFLQSILLGAVFGLLYDAFRITRIAVKTPRGVVFAEDVLFFMVCAILSFFFLMSTLDGQLRLFLFVGIGLGALLYSLTLGVVVMKVSQAIIQAIKAVLRFIIRLFFRPVYRLIYWICRQFLRPVRFLADFWKKTYQRCKYRLKVQCKVLYNRLRSMLMSKVFRMRKSAHGAQKNKP